MCTKCGGDIAVLIYKYVRHTQWACLPGKYWSHTKQFQTPHWINMKPFCWRIGNESSNTSDQPGEVLGTMNYCSPILVIRNKHLWSSLTPHPKGLIGVPFKLCKLPMHLTRASARANLRKDLNSKCQTRLIWSDARGAHACHTWPARRLAETMSPHHLNSTGGIGLVIAWHTSWSSGYTTRWISGAPITCEDQKTCGMFWCHESCSRKLMLATEETPFSWSFGTAFIFKHRPHTPHIWSLFLQIGFATKASWRFSRLPTEKHHIFFSNRRPDPP